jgi:hypothetical protein
LKKGHRESDAPLVSETSARLYASFVARMKIANAALDVNEGVESGQWKVVREERGVT